MADPTLKDVLKAIATMRVESEKRFDALEKGQAEIRREMATKKELGALESRVDRRLETLESRVDRRLETLATKKEMRERFDAVDDRLEALRTDVDANQAATLERFNTLEKKVDSSATPRSTPATTSGSFGTTSTRSTRGS